MVVSNVRDDLRRFLGKNYQVYICRNWNETSYLPCMDWMYCVYAWLHKKNIIMYIVLRNESFALSD